MRIKNKTVLLTGGTGFFGELLKKELLKKRYKVVSIDLEKDTYKHANLISIQGDIRNKSTLSRLAKKYKFIVIFHIAAILAHAAKDKNFLWTSNVDGTRNIAEMAKKFNIPKIIFISSNCLWGKSFNRPVMESDMPEPVEIYGKSKWEAEKIFIDYHDFITIIFRSPTIIDSGRLGLLAILFAFINEGKKVWVVGGGNNRYQFIYAQDLINACIRAISYHKSDIFNIGSDDVPTLKEVYEYIIKKVGSKSRVANLPRFLAVPMMKIAHALKISPLGPYQYSMIAESFIFDTSKIKHALKWKPTLTNKDMMYKAYLYYHNNLQEIKNREHVSAHKQIAEMGVIRLLKWVS